MRRALFALVLLALSWPAQAQIFPNIPPNTVLGRLGAGQTGSPQPIPLASLFAQFATTAAPFTINPPSGTLTQAFVANQTLPTCGAGCPQTAQLNANIFTVINPGWYVDNGNSVNLDAYGLSPMDAGLRVNYSAQGGVNYSIHTGLAVGAIDSGTANQLIGTLSAASSNINTSGTDTLWGVIGTGDAGPSANISAVHAIEAELGLHPSATVAQRTGLSIASFGSGKGSSIDAAIYVYEVGPVATGYGNGASFDNLILMDAGGPNPPVSSTGNIISSRGGSFSVGSIINLPSVSCTGNIINVPKLVISCAGAGTLTGPNFPSAGLTVGTTSGGAVISTASTNQNPGFDGIQAEDSQNKVNLSVGVWEANDTGTIFGQTRGLFAGVIQFDATGNGLLLGTNAATPLILGTNNTAWLTINSAGTSTFSGSVIQTINQNAGTIFEANNDSAGTAAFAGFTATNNAGISNAGSFGVGGTGFTGVGGLLQNQAFVTSVGLSGIAIVTQGAHPIVFGINSSEVGRWDQVAPGQLDLGTQGGLVGAVAFLNATSGAITIKPPTGALGSATLTLPDVTDTLAVLGTNQTFSATQTFSGTVNFTGTVEAGGSAGATQTCTVNQAKTLIFTKGILTGGTCNT